MLEKTEGAIKNWKSTHTGFIRHTRHRRKTNKTKTKHNTETYKDDHHGPHQHMTIINCDLYLFNDTRCQGILQVFG